MSSTGNSGALQSGQRGNGKPPCQIVMTQFDMLPASVRAAVRDADLDWDTGALVANLRRGVTAEAIVRHIQDYERKYRDMAKPIAP